MTGILSTNDMKVRAFPSQRNTYGLLPGPRGTCPGATEGPGGCWEQKPGMRSRTCYAEKLRRCRTGVDRVLGHNTDLLRSLDREGMRYALEEEFDRFQIQSFKKGLAKQYYRLHWSGDLFSKEYSLALADTIKEFPDVTFWTYTRSFEIFQPLVGLDNLVLYLSLDKVNMDEGMELLDKYPVVPAFMGNFLPSDKRLKGTVECPVDSGKMGLEGACVRCKLCLKGKKVIFKVKKNARRIKSINGK